MQDCQFSYSQALSENNTIIGADGEAIISEKGSPPQPATSEPKPLTSEHETNQENTHQEEAPTKSSETTPAQNNSIESTVFIIGLNVGRRNVNPSVLVRGKVTDNEALNFKNWLIPYDTVLKALNFTTQVVSDNEVELRSPFKITRINLNQLHTDPELGLVFSIQQIEDILGIKANFNLREYAIVFDVPQVKRSGSNDSQERPVLLEGLPEFSASDVTLSMLEQRVSLLDTESSSMRSQGSLSAVGTLFDSSWFVRLNQRNLAENQTWQLSEAQILRQTDSSDYYLGSQPTFWRSQRGGDFWGFTTIQRQGFSPYPIYGTGGANPSRRLQPERVTATVTGRAEPGTLVRLVRNIYSGQVVAEQLVDSSGTYRFDNVPVGRQIGTNYQVLLYTDGLLTAEPQIEEARFTILPEQLPTRASALIISGGWQRRLDANDFLGEFTQFNAGVAQRWGLTEDLTVGVGAVYDSSFNALAEVFYQPKGSPLRVAVSGLIGDDVDVNASLIWDDFPYFYATLSSDFDDVRYTLDWQISPQFRFFSNGNLDQGANFGIQYFSGGANSTTLARVSVDTDTHLSWSLYQRLGKFYLTHQGNSVSTASQLSYRFTPYQSLVLNYNTRSSSNTANLLTAYWRYRSPTRTRYGESLWQAELGYSIGSQGSGIYATAGTTILPGILLQARYQGVSLTSDQSSFSLQLVSSLGFQQGITPGDRQLERLRTQGGLLVQPFFDLNSNGKRDSNEEVYTDNSEFLIVNNELVKPQQIDIKNDRFLMRLPPGNYRLDLEAAGFPPDFQPSVNAFAVEVVEGSYTPILIPLQPSYTVAGVVTDTEGKPIGGARVEAISTNSSSSILSVTNSAGVYYLEQLRQGTYQLKINGQSVESNITINADSETLQELNLKLP
ncbi:MAG: carboxypeptidase-like regulatory domain-containing protein [Coleofasciculus sp. S288]|nr:carboxypeptidase-like regulatory domain-containing protein [Coleofasciculus sp. S288]